MTCGQLAGLYMKMEPYRRGRSARSRIADGSGVCAAASPGQPLGVRKIAFCENHTPRGQRYCSMMASSSEDEGDGVEHQTANQQQVNGSSSSLMCVSSSAGGSLLSKCKSLPPATASLSQSQTFKSSRTRDRSGGGGELWSANEHNGVLAMPPHSQSQNHVHVEQHTSALCSSQGSPSAHVHLQAKAGASASASAEAAAASELELLDLDPDLVDETKLSDKGRQKLRWRRARKRILTEKRSSVPVISIPVIPSQRFALLLYCILYVRRTSHEHVVRELEVLLQVRVRVYELVGITISSHHFRLEKMGSNLEVAEKDEFMRQMYSYWQLKRQWRFGVPLLRRFVSAQQDASKITLLKQKLAQSLGIHCTLLH